MCFEQEKAILRKKYLRNIRLLDEGFVQATAGAFQRQVCSTEAYRRADSVFIYLSVGNEPATRSLIRYALDSNKSVFVPKCLPHGEMNAVRIDRDTTFKLNRFSIPEPENTIDCLPADTLDLCIVPCVAASMDGGRLGRGGGYYDRFLAGSATFKMCLCYEMNLAEHVYVTPTDVFMDAIITEKRMIACR